MVILSSGRMLLTLVCEEDSYFSFLSSLRSRSIHRSQSVTCSHADPVVLTSVFVSPSWLRAVFTRAKIKSNFSGPISEKARIALAKHRSRIRLTAQQR